MLLAGKRYCHNLYALNKKQLIGTETMAIITKSHRFSRLWQKGRIPTRTNTRITEPTDIHKD